MLNYKGKPDAKKDMFKRSKNKKAKKLVDPEDADDTIYYDSCQCYKRENCYWDGLDSSGRLQKVLGCGIAQKMKDLFDLDDECWDSYFVGHT